jgi:hypothetical protein
MKQLMFFFLSVLLIAGCTLGSTSPDAAVTSPPEDQVTPSPSDVPDFLPQPGDSALSRGNVFINSTELLIRESFPPQVSLGINGDLPTPCHQLRVDISDPDAENRIFADVYSVVDPNQACIQVLKPFEEYIDLGTFATGHYSVWVNGELVGEFDT